MKDFRRLLGYLGPYRKDAIAGAVVVAIETSLELFIPLLMAGIIDQGIMARDTQLILRQGALMLLCAFISLACGLLYARFSARTAVGLGTNLRQAEYEKIQTFAFGNLDRYQTSSLVTRMTTDITVIQNAVASGFRPLVRGPVMLVMGLLYASFMNMHLATVFFIILPLLAIALGIIVRRVSPFYRRFQTAMDHLNGVVQEDVTAVRAIKAYVRADYEREKFGGVNREVASWATRTFGTAVCNLPIFQLSMYVAATLVLWIGGHMIIAGELKVGQLTGFMSYVLQIINSLMMISNVFLLLTRALTSVERCSEVLDEAPELFSAPQGQAISTVSSGRVEFRDVSFKYGADADQDVLEDINLDIPSGTRVGILGGTGSGKTSLVQLIARLYDVDQGQVLLDGHDVRDYDLTVLRDAVGIVLQKNVLFTGTVRENLLWGNEGADDDELLEACRLACVDEFLERIGGLDGDLGQGGDNVSGGQKQRLCIARTLLKRPRVLIFDDSTSAVDMATEAKIRSNLAAIPDVTTIVIAQRITSVMDAEQIIVLDNGRVHACGTHDELLETDTIYQEIYASQTEFVQAARVVSSEGDETTAGLIDEDSRGPRESSWHACAPEREPGDETGTSDAKGVEPRG
ncbi:ABC transporter related protein [Coriobacterium glomerans PW2]|uniref:ABC transporter related protein n=1 Tax=Coriobacterium glomerans (strain ATCC 49209 / DSM 20642 / JCM 10262 / PW2) TaxID=700015 RepID=F2N8V1_CORGP|nr:ABC transporter ATP-binding protein [Coriobacterium glomerans]AEB07551.1 ABC transporter related protein [Coriobacterium glomerans PW2]